MSWEQEQARNREEVTNRSRQWSTVNDSDDDEKPPTDESKQGAGVKEQTVRKRSRSPDNSGSSSSDSSSDEGSESEEESSRKKAKKEKKHEKSSKKKHKKEKKEKKEKKSKHKKHHKKEKKHKSDRDKTSSSSSSSSSSSGVTSGAVNQNVFGKYGIIREQDFFSKQREFEVYMSEVKGIDGIMGQSKREIMTCFKDFIEDYNTATMPHEKYYAFERWEMQEYHRQQQDKQHRTSTGAVKTSFSDEAERFAEVKRLKALAEQREFDEVKARIAANAVKQESMRRQGLLQGEMQLAFKQGDAATQKRLARLLEPEEEGPAVKHPWA